MSKRSDWTFQYGGGSLSGAARRQAAYHRERETFWQKEQGVAEVALKEKGFVVEEYAVTGGYQAQAKIDPTLQTRYTDCYKKRMEHQRKAEEYEGWADVMAKHPGQTFDLHHDDVLFFGLELPA